MWSCSSTLRSLTTAFRTRPALMSSGLLILGPVERAGALVDAKTGEHAGYSQPTHTVLSFRKGDVFQGTASFYATGIDIEPDGGLVGDDGPDIRWNTRGSEWGNWVGGVSSSARTVMKPCTRPTGRPALPASSTVRRRRPPLAQGVRDAINRLVSSTVARYHQKIQSMNASS